MDNYDTMNSPEMVRGLKPRVTATILLGLGWLSFVGIFLIFWAGSMGILQAIGVIVVSIVITIGLLIAMWASWGMGMAFRQNEICCECAEECMKKHGKSKKTKRK